MNQRIFWIDALKVVGMMFIVLGHMFPLGHEMIYAFSLPLFLMLSGLVSRRIEDSRLFWSKLWHGLIVPMMIFSLIYLVVALFLEGNMQHLNLRDLSLWALQNAGGCQWGMLIAELPGLNTCWYLYSLMLIKIVYNYTPLKLQYFLLVPAGVAAVVYWHNAGISYPSAWTAGVLAYPLFMAGTLLNPYIDRLTSWQPNSIWHWILALASVYIMRKIVHYNDWPQMYVNNYGNNYLLFLLDAAAGIYLVFFVIKLMEPALRKYQRILTVLALGNIFTLATHFYAINYLYDPLHTTSITIGTLTSVAYTLAMYPIILLVLKFWPALAGLKNNYGKSSSAVKPFLD